LDYTEGISILKVKSAMQTKLQFFSTCLAIMPYISKGKPSKLPPYIILNRKTVPKENFCKDLIVQAQKNAWMMSELMEDWLGYVWEYRPGALSKPWSMLVMDVFHGRLSDRIRNRLRNKGTNLVIIPSGMTNQLKTLDVSINEPFTQLVCKHCDAWLNKDNHILTHSGKLKRASASIIVEWIPKLENNCQCYSKIVFKVLFV
jgi:hypothetical protein